MTAEELKAALGPFPCPVIVTVKGFTATYSVVTRNSKYDLTKAVFQALKKLDLNPKWPKGTMLITSSIVPGL